MQSSLFPQPPVDLEFCSCRFFLDSHFFPVEQAEILFKRLHDETEWRQDKVFVYGKNHLIPRLNAWYGVKDYTYSRNTMPARPFTETLDQINQKLLQRIGYSFNSVLVNLYRDGQDTMGWHADYNDGSDPDTPIASLSFGASRRFLLREKASLSSGQPPQRTELLLRSGSLLVMYPPAQERTQHSLPRSKKIHHPRINLTFRCLV